jgi:hypothetical protein
VEHGSGAVGNVGAAREPHALVRFEGRGGGRGPPLADMEMVTYQVEGTDPAGSGRRAGIGEIRRPQGLNHGPFQRPQEVTET